MKIRNLVIYFILSLQIIGNFAFANDEEKLQDDSLIYRKELNKATNEIIRDYDIVKHNFAKLNKAIEDKSQTIKLIRENTPKINISLISQEEKNEYLANIYQNLIKDWRILVDDSLDFFSTKEEFFTQKPASLEKNFKIPEEFSHLPENKKYLKHKKLLAEKYEDFSKNKKLFIELTEGYQSKLLLEIGKKRSDILNLIKERDLKIILENEFFLDDLARELKLIPYRPIMFFYSKILDYKEMTKSGFSGYVQISSQIFILLSLLIILFFGVSLFKKINLAANKFKTKLIRSSFKNKYYKFSYQLFSRFLPYAPWVFLIATFHLISSSISEFDVIIPYFTYYFCYRIFKLFIRSSLNKIIYSNRNYYSIHNQELNNKISNSTNILGAYLLYLLWILHLTQTVVRQGLIYNIVSSLFTIGLILTILYLSHKWKKEILSNYKNNKFYNYKLSFLICPIILIFLTFSNLVQKALHLISKIDFFKRILAQIYHKKLQSAAKNNQNEEPSQKLPQSYIDNFTKQESNFFNIRSHPHQEISEIINLWQQDQNKENSLVIYGESGVGKSYLLRRIGSEINEQENKEKIKIINISFTKKITTKKEISQYIADLLNIKSEESLEKAIENYQEKTLLILNNCENLFLSKKSGLEAFQYFADLVNISSNNIFWLSSFHKYSWNYLFYATDHSNYFRNYIEVPRWKDIDIKNLILTNHNKSNFKLIYDSLFFDMPEHSQKDLEDIEEKFFQLLWAKSQGNPDSAIYLWLSSLKVIDQDSLKINPPQSAKYSELLKLSDSHIFVYSAIAKHQKLSMTEILQTVDLPKGLVLNALKIGLEKEYLTKENNRYLLSNKWQILILEMLIKKNFIYE